MWGWNAETAGKKIAKLKGLPLCRFAKFTINVESPTISIEGPTEAYVTGVSACAEALDPARQDSDLHVRPPFF